MCIVILIISIILLVLGIIGLITSALNNIKFLSLEKIYLKEFEQLIIKWERSQIIKDKYIKERKIILEKLGIDYYE